MEGLTSFRKRLMTNILIETVPLDTSSAQTQLEHNIDSHIAKVTDEKVGVYRTSHHKTL